MSAKKPNDNPWFQTTGRMNKATLASMALRFQEAVALIRDANEKLYDLSWELIGQLESIPTTRRNGAEAEELLEVINGVGSITSLLDKAEEIVTVSDDE